jgi:hypothetical protein
MRIAYTILMRKSEGKRLLWRPRHEWKDSIKMDATEIGYEDVDWIKLAQERVQWRVFVNKAVNLQGSFFTSLLTISFST